MISIVIIFLSPTPCPIIPNFSSRESPRVWITATRSATRNATTTGTNKYIYLDASANLWTFGTSRTITQNDLDSKVYWYASGVNTTATISDIMVSTSGGDYEPYTNGASPNPDYPQEVKNVAGDNTINICGKNLANYLIIMNIKRRISDIIMLAGGSYEYW